MSKHLESVKAQEKRGLSKEQKEELVICQKILDWLESGKDVRSALLQACVNDGVDTAPTSARAQCYTSLLHGISTTVFCTHDAICFDRFGDWNVKETDWLNSNPCISGKPVVYLINLNEDKYIKKKSKWLPKVTDQLHPLCFTFDFGLLLFVHGITFCETHKALSNCMPSVRYATP